MNSFNDNLEYWRKLMIKHYSKPNNKGLINGTDSLIIHQASASCVDDFHIELIIKNNLIFSGRFDGIGCAISTAAIDIFLELITNKSTNDVKLIIKNYELMLQEQEFDEIIIGKMLAFKNVPRQRNRIKCALIGINGVSKLIETEH